MIYIKFAKMLVLWKEKMKKNQCFLYCFVSRSAFLFALLENRKKI